MLWTRTILISSAVAAFLAAAIPAPAHAAPASATIQPLVASYFDVQTDWDWNTFKKFWKRQAGKTAGVTGIVTLVVAAGVLIVMSAKKKT